MTIGERIRHVRQLRNLTQKQLGELSGIAEPTIRRYELGKLNPKYETLKKIASALQVTASYLVDGRRRLGDMMKHWLSDKSAHIDMSIDSELLDILELFAKEDGLSLEDEIEKILHEDAEARIENDTTGTEDVTGLK